MFIFFTFYEFILFQYHRTVVTVVKKENGAVVTPKRRRIFILHVLCTNTILDYIVFQHIFMHQFLIVKGKYQQPHFINICFLFHLFDLDMALTFGTNLQRFLGRCMFCNGFFHIFPMHVCLHFDFENSAHFIILHFVSMFKEQFK